MLIGADCSHIGDRCIRVTIHHCFFDGTRQRHPRLRFGKVHLYNNYTRNWGIYAVCASVEAKVLKSSVHAPNIIKFNKKAKYVVRTDVGAKVRKENFYALVIS
jgi:pectate lyase